MVCNDVVTAAAELSANRTFEYRRRVCGTSDNSGSGRCHAWLAEHVVLPSFVIVLTLSFLYYKYRQLDAIQAVLKGLRPAVVALIASAGVSLGIDAFWGGKAISLADLNIESVLLFALGFLLLRKYKKSPITVMLLCGVLAVGYGFLSGSLAF